MRSIQFAPFLEVNATINIMNLFHAFVWLNQAMKLLMKNHKIHPICSIPRSECSNKYYEFISCLCMVEQSTKILMENHETCPIGSVPFLKVNATTFDLYFHDWYLIMDMVIKKISDKFCHLKWHNNVKKGKENVKILANKMKVYIIITMVKAI